MKQFLVSFSFILSFLSVELQTNIDTSSELFILSRFLELQSELCGYVQLCTIEKRTNLTFSFQKQPCCRPCSCDETCSDVGNCCPDFLLRDLRNSSLNYSAAATKRTETIYQRHYLNTEIKDNVTSCVSSRLHSRSTRFGFQGADEGFIMISFCPDLYNGIETRTNCERALQLQRPLKNALIPVTSVDTGRTYRNLFCLICHEGREKRFVPWESWLTCDHKNVVQNFIAPPDTLFPYIVLQYFSYCNIVYRPPSTVNLRKITCKQADVTSCQEKKSKHTTTATTLYEQMCREFYLPVYEIVDGTLTIYRNVACYLCSKGKDLPKYCSSLYPIRGEYNLQINVKRSTLNERYEHVLSYLDIQFDSICGPGYIYDDERKHCRRVVCPRVYYIYNGSCEPIIEHIQGVYFKVMLEVTPNNLITSQFYREYEDRIYSSLTRAVTSTFSDMHIDMWRITENENLISNVAILKFRNENITYAIMTHQLQTLLDKISVLPNNSAKVNIAVNMEEKKDLNRLPVLINGDTGVVAVPVRVFPKIYLDVAEFEISTSHFCYRLELKSSEVLHDGKFKLKVLRTGVRLQGVNYELTENMNPVACIGDVILIKSTSNWHFTAENISVDIQYNLFIPFITIGSLIALAFLFAVVRLIKRCIHVDE